MHTLLYIGDSVILLVSNIFYVYLNVRFFYLKLKFNIQWKKSLLKLAFSADVKLQDQFHLKAAGGKSNQKEYKKWQFIQGDVLGQLWDIFRRCFLHCCGMHWQE